MNFREWFLLNEVGRRSEITVEPGMTVPLEKGGKEEKMGDEKDIKKLTHEGLMRYFQQLDPKGWRFLKNRYNFHVAEIRDHWENVTFHINIIPITPEGGEEEVAEPDHPQYDYYQKYHGGKTGKTLYKTPQDAIEEIEADPGFGYRGMAWEEWQSINRTGYVQSRGQYNIGQEGYTMFGQTPDTALHYAHGFAPLPYQVGYKRPGVVIAVDRRFLRTHQDDPENIPQSELGLLGPLEKKHITHAWMMTMTSVHKRQGNVELRFKWVPDWDVKKHKDPRMGFFVIRGDRVSIGSAQLSSGVGYAIRPMF